jgi:hypothetical protein
VNQDRPAGASKHCTVTGPAKYVERAGGAPALCEAVEAAVRRAAPTATPQIQIRVASAASLAATIRLHDGRQLPDQHLAVSDGPMTPVIVGRFADAIAEQIAAATKD